MSGTLPQADRSVPLTKRENWAGPDFPQAAYVHIPFCRRRCYYCDFPISVLGDRTDASTSSAVEEYVGVLCEEIETTPVLGSSLETVFLGGGTPSLLPVRHLERILATLQRRFGIAGQAEISLEIDPGTFTKERLRGFRQAGVNRLSLGIQAFQEDLLRVCGRSHSLREGLEAIEAIGQVGIANFSLDLMSGLPHQTLEDWQFSLETALNFAPPHLSCYDLVLEPVTAFGKIYRPGERPLPGDETTAQMYRLTREFLTQAGYQHYEISNYARPGYPCRHNRIYWENRPYYGFGMGAASYTRQQRFSRPRNRKDYYAWVRQFQSNGGILDCPQSSKIDILLETLMLGLRLQEGVDLSEIGRHFGQEVLREIWQGLRPYYDLGWVEVTGRHPSRETGEAVEFLSDVERIRLNDPEGFLFSNQILSSLFERFINVSSECASPAFGSGVRVLHGARDIDAMFEEIEFPPNIGNE